MYSKLSTYSLEMVGKSCFSHNPKVIGSNPAPATTYVSRLTQVKRFIFLPEIEKKPTKSQQANKNGRETHKALLFFYACFPKIASAIHSAERSSASLIICEYRSLVVEGFACPSRPDMLIVSMPLK